MQYLTFGFPLSIGHRADSLHNFPCNHQSALQFPEEVKKYIEKELSHNALLGPASLPIDNTVHVSPLLTRPKDLDSRRIIVDLSYPKGLSLNDCVDRDRFGETDFKLELPTIDDIVEDIVKFSDPFLAKIDISRAFRNLRVDPGDATKFGIRWGDSYYLDLAAAFGWVHGTSAFEMCSSALEYYFRGHRITMHPYIDDMVYIFEGGKQEEFLCVKKVIASLGLPINDKKLSAPAKQMSCLGIHIDLVEKTLSIDSEKINDIHNFCKNLANKNYLSRRTFQSLLGKLFYVHKCVKPARVFMNRMLLLYRQQQHHPKTKLLDDFKLDLAWFIKFLKKLMVSQFLTKTKPHKTR